VNIDAAPNPKKKDSDDPPETHSGVKNDRIHPFKTDVAPASIGRLEEHTLAFTPN